MKKCIIIVSTLVLCLSSYMQARDISPTFSIRYEDFINSASPSAAIGLKLDIDGDRYTGFQVNSDGTDSRLLVGWNWGVIGIGALPVILVVNLLTIHLVLVLRLFLVCQQILNIV